MIRALLGDEDSPVKTVILGLSRKNIEHLMAGYPIFKEMKDMGFPDLSIAVFFGETEEAMRDDFRVLIKTIGAKMEEVQAEAGDHTKESTKKEPR